MFWQFTVASHCYLWKDFRMIPIIYRHIPKLVTHDINWSVYNWYLYHYKGGDYRVAYHCYKQEYKAFVYTYHGDLVVRNYSRPLDYTIIGQITIRDQKIVCTTNRPLNNQFKRYMRALSHIAVMTLRGNGFKYIAEHRLHGDLSQYQLSKW